MVLNMCPFVTSTSLVQNLMDLSVKTTVQKLTFFQLSFPIVRDWNK